MFANGAFTWTGDYYFPGGGTTPPRDTPAVLGMLMRITDGGVPLGTTWEAITCAALLAVQHANARDGRIVAALSGLPSSDRLDLQYSIFDTGSTPASALQAYQSAKGDGAHAILGPAKSTTSEAVALHAGANMDALTQLSYWVPDSNLWDPS